MPSSGPHVPFNWTTTIQLGPDPQPVLRRGAQYLAEQVQRRTGWTWSINTDTPLGGAPDTAEGPIITIELHDHGLEDVAVDVDPLGPSARVIASAPSVVLAAVGQLLRSFELGPGRATVPAASWRNRPAYPVRGQIIANHKQNNTCDLWDFAEWEEYLTELAAWGNNLIILFAVDVAHWHGSLPFAPEPWFDHPERQQEWDRQLEIQLRLPQLCHELGMRHGIYMSPNDIWPQEVVNNPALAKNTAAFACPNDPAGRERITTLRRQLFAMFPALDVLFIPSRDEGGCPGCEACDPWAPTFVELVEEQVALVREFHPDCRIWLSQQGLPASETQIVLDWLDAEPRPEIEALVYGPFSEAMTYSDPDGPGGALSLENDHGPGVTAGGPAILRRHLNGAYDLILYPDETHTYRAQYPVIDMDPVVQYVWNREDAPAPRVNDTVEQFQLTAPPSVGAAPYSEGDTDDVNKIAWSALLWDPTIDAAAIAHAYAAWFFGHDVAQPAQQLVLAIERALHTAVLADREQELRRSALVEAERRRPSLLSDWRWLSLRLCVELLEHIGVVYRRDRELGANLRYRVAEFHEKVDPTEGLQRTIDHLDTVFATDEARVAAIVRTRAALFDLHQLRARAVVRVQHSYMGFDLARDRLVSVLARIRAGELTDWRERVGAIGDAIADAEDSHLMAASGKQIVDHLREYSWETGATTWSKP